ncbi:putative glycolipid-binding domain-containing protein [Pseudonocardia sp. WMMC193]|uniref:putative glycolipid-binding domain-containing protein n=1 Tax=Pseudonocardia sp. WMMC193 TaxID=2911965 RepID=UPI001F2ACB65|nr:putative glycolipid-binding domain-containing protein [Pseudonocardia sp. WMMC193]MCF7551693.1 putative glycolipid-binding domain-containing protein [Pseudonocardia sp. WMMC193]
MTTMLTWQAEGRPGLEGVRVHFGPGPLGFRALGRIVRPDPSGDLTASYNLVVREDGTLLRLSVTAATMAAEKHLTIQRTDDGFWLLDDGSGSTRADFDGAVDLDLEFSPLFNSLPIRRLGLHREAGAVEVPMVFVSLPDLTVTTAVQEYRTVRVGAGDVPAQVGFTWEDFSADLAVDVDGFVISYPGLAALLSSERVDAATA